MKSFEKACEGAAHSRRVQPHVAFLDAPIVYLLCT